jgi:hypothetical protein
MLLPLWSKIQDPVLISKDPVVWLRLTPEEIYLTPFIGIDSTIVSSVGVKSIVETFFADSPSCKKNDSLPAFKIPTSLDSSFVLNLYIEINTVIRLKIIDASGSQRLMISLFFKAAINEFV